MRDLNTTSWGNTCRWGVQYCDNKFATFQFSINHEISSIPKFTGQSKVISVKTLYYNSCPVSYLVTMKNELKFKYWTASKHRSDTLTKPCVQYFDRAVNINFHIKNAFALIIHTIH